MNFRIVRIAAVLTGCILSATGCIRQGSLDTDREAIRFTAESTLLRHDALTKSTTETFTPNVDQFIVFGEKVTSTDQHSPVFEGVTVSYLQDQVQAAYWKYENPRSWNWTSQSERYDFVAVFPANMGTTKENNAGNISVSTHYDYLTGAPSGGDKQDILAATYRRNGTDWERRFDRVDLSFNHMGSAVAIKIVNNSSTASVTLNNLRFSNLVVSADAKVSLDNYGASVLRWANLTPDAAEVRQLSPGTAIEVGNDWTSEYQIMIPQNLTWYNPTLKLNYTVGGNTTDTSVPLNGIERADGSPITSWDPGVKYTYIISMRLDGGLLVTVTTTPWDEPVQAETPGILI